MITKNMTIAIKSGMDARPVAVFVQVASQYDSSVYLQIDNKKVNAKSIMGMMTLGLSAGEEIEIIVEGADEATAMEQIEKYLCGA